MNVQRITALMTGTVRGARVSRTIRLEIDPDRTELDFAPGDGDRPTQARVHHRVWIHQLRRWDWHSELVVQDSIQPA